MLVLAMRVQVRMRVGDLAMLVAMGVDEVGPQQQLAIGEDLLRRAVGGNASLLQHDDPLRNVFDDLESGGWQ